MDGQRDDGSTTRTDAAGDTGGGTGEGDGTAVAESPAQPADATVAHRVPAPREAPDDATTTAATGSAAPAAPAPPSPGHQHTGPGEAGQHGSGQHGGGQYGGQGYAPPPAWGPGQGGYASSGGPGHAPPGHPGGQWGGPPPAPWTGPQQAQGWGGPPPWGPPTGRSAPGRRRPRRAIVIGAVALVLVVALVVVTVVLVDGALTRRAATRAADDVASWPGVTYRGQVDDGLGGPASVEMTVDARGTAAGTITRAAGGRAEFVLTRTNRAIRADEAWWRASAPRPRLATKLGGVWLSGADDQLAAVSGWAVPPADLSRSVTGRPWSDDSTRPLGGVRGDVLADGDDRITLDESGDTPRLAEVELAGFGSRRTSPVAAARATPDALGAVGTAATGVPSMPAFRAAVASPPLAFSRIDPIPDCFTPQCPVTVRVTNIGRYRTTGTLEVLQNDAPAASFPLDVAPGADAVFTASLQNQAFTTNTASVTTRVLARLTDLE